MSIYRYRIIDQFKGVEVGACNTLATAEKLTTNSGFVFYNKEDKLDLERCLYHSKCEFSTREQTGLHDWKTTHHIKDITIFKYYVDDFKLHLEIGFTIKQKKYKLSYITGGDYHLEYAESLTFEKQPIKFIRHTGSIYKLIPRVFNECFEGFDIERIRKV